MEFSLHAPPYHPTTNGRAEKMVRELKTALRKQEHGTLSYKVARFLFKQHTTPHSGTGKTPAEALMGRRLRSLLEMLRLNSNKADECSLVMFGGYSEAVTLSTSAILDRVRDGWQLQFFTGKVMWPMLCGR